MHIDPDLLALAKRKGYFVGYNGGTDYQIERRHLVCFRGDRADVWDFLENQSDYVVTFQKLHGHARGRGCTVDRTNDGRYTIGHGGAILRTGLTAIEARDYLLTLPRMD